MRLKNLPPSRVPILNTKVVEALPPQQRPGVTPRLRGRAGVERRERWLRRHPLCVHCAREDRAVPATVVDHIKPLADGGEDHEKNFQSLCTNHHDAKTAAEATARSRKK